MLYVQDQEIMIKNYTGIMALNNDLFECRIDQKIISIQGKEIEIKYFGHDEILLKGQFSLIRII